MSLKKAALEVSQEHKDRVRKIAKDSNTTIKDASCAILGWALPHFEQGGEYRLVGVTVSRKDNTVPFPQQQTDNP